MASPQRDQADESEELTMGDEPDTDVDTESLTVRVQDLLEQHRITQEVFGKRVVGCSQGHVHNLLYKPKPFSQLSATGKKPYLKMMAFIRGDGLEERIRDLAGYRAAPRKRTPHPDPEALPGSRPRKKRITLSPEQKSAMEEIYDENAYPTRAEIEEVADQLDLPHDTVRFWFNNKRRLEKQRLRDIEGPASEGTGHEESEVGQSSGQKTTKEAAQGGKRDEGDGEDSDNDDADDDGEEEGEGGEESSSSKEGEAAGSSKSKR